MKAVMGKVSMLCLWSKIYYEHSQTTNIQIFINNLLNTNLLSNYDCFSINFILSLTISFYYYIIYQLLYYTIQNLSVLLEKEYI